HGGFAVGVNHTRPIADDAAVLLIFAGQEAGHILQGDDGDVVRITNADEVGRFDRGFDVNAARQHHRLVSDDADDPTVEPGKANHHVFGPQAVYLKKATVIYHTGDDLTHIIRFMGI